MKEFTFEEHLNELMKDCEFRKAREDSQPEFDIIRGICEARAKNKITQKELSKKSGISQADLSRIENGNANPSLSTLKRIAAALGCTLSITFNKE